VYSTSPVGMRLAGWVWGRHGFWGRGRIGVSARQCKKETVGKKKILRRLVFSDQTIRWIWRPDARGVVTHA
jgi:hypothetical protein